MKIKILQPVEFDVSFIKVDVPVRYEEEDIGNDFPLRKNNSWSGIIELSTGKIVNWPKDKIGDYRLNMKVCDEGKYQLLDSNYTPIGNDEPNCGYVPNKIIPGQYGDYIDLEITDGIVTNWPKNLSTKDFDYAFTSMDL